MPKISCILIATGRLHQLSQSIASFLAQDFEDAELLVINILIRQTLVFEHPRIRIYNIKQENVMPMWAKTHAVNNHARGEIIIAWDEMSIYLPGFLSQIANAINGREWCWLDTELCIEGLDTVRKEQASEFSFAYKREIFGKVGPYPPGIRGASDRLLIGRITKLFPGDVTLVSLNSVNLMRLGSAEERERIQPAINSGNIKLEPRWERDYSLLADTIRVGKRDKRICFVELGRYGDIINLLPVLKMVHDTYETPYLMVSSEFASLLDGVSYVKPTITQLKNEHLARAISVAEQDFSIVINAQIWGQGWTQKKRTTCYNKESWSNAGMLHLFDDPKMFPVFDRRNPKREQKLIDTCIPDYGSRKTILVNVSKGISSPCPACAELLSDIQKVWGEMYNVVDLSTIVAERIYDFLGLFEVADCLVCIDTSFLHLAPATEIPVVAIVNDKNEGWASTAVRCGNAVSHIKYSEVNKDNRRMLHESIAAAMELVKGDVVVADTHERVTNRNVYHVVERHHESDSKTLERKMRCWDSWDRLYERGEMIPVHVWEYLRDARDIGEARALPYFKDLLDAAMDQMNPDDILIWTNDDNLLHPEVVDYLRFHVSVYGPCTSFRSEFTGMVPPLTMPPKLWDANTTRHMGRDIFACTKKWLMTVWDQIPDFIIGNSDFDLCLAALVRNYYKLPTTNKNISEPLFPAEIPRGFVGHQYHQSHWSRPDYVNTAAGQIHNRKLFKAWADKYCTTLVFNENNTLK